MKLVHHSNGTIVQVIEEPGKVPRNEIIVRVVYADTAMEKAIFHAVKAELDRRASQ